MHSTPHVPHPAKLLASGLLLSLTALSITPFTWAETVAGVEVRALTPMVSAAATLPTPSRKDVTATAPLTQTPQFTDISKILESAKSLPEPKPAPVQQPTPSSGQATPVFSTLPATAANALSPSQPQSPPPATTYLAHSASTSANTILPTPTKPYAVTVGKSELMTLPKRVIRVALSSPAVASVNIISPTQLQLVGHTPGVATLTLWHTRNSDAFSRVDIEVQRDVSALAYRLHAIDKRLTVEPIPAENSLILSGHVDTREEAQLALEIAKAYMDEQAASGSSGGSGITAASTTPSSNAASSSGGAGSSNSAGSNSNASSSTPSVPLLSSFAPGSTFSSNAPNIINLIRVAGEPMTKSAMVREKLKAIDEAIQMDVVPGANGQEKVMLTGSVRTAGQVSQAINLVSVFYGQPGLKVITGPGGNSVRDTGSTEFHASDKFSDNMTINILQGSIVSDASGAVVSMLTVRQRPQIRTRVKVLDVNRSALRQLGSNLLAQSGTISAGNFNGGQIPGPGKTISTLDPKLSGASLSRVINPATSGLTGSITPIWGGGVTQFLSLNDNMVLAISALTESRKGRSLAEPTLISLSGEKASFLAGGELPIPLLGANGQLSVEYHEFGIRLNLVATVKDDGTIHMHVAPEVSSIDTVNGITTPQVTVPAFAARRFQTTVELKPHESLMMAGLFNQEETDAASRFPGIGNIPIIGSFFKGKYADHRDREMVVIIQPEVVYQDGL